MSIRFDGNIANYLSRVASLPDYNSPYTAMGWLKWKVDNAATQAAFSLSPASAANAFDFFGIAADAWAISSRLDDDEIQSTGGSTAVIDKWIHWVMVRNSVTDIRIYIDLVEDAQATIDITGRVAADICSVGRLSVGGDGFVPLDAEVAFLRIWTTNLTTTELAAERLSRRAVKTVNLFGDYPMLTTTTAGEDVSGNANHFTVNGTVATGASEPPLIAGPSLFRGRGFTFFDDEQVNRFEFWPAISDVTEVLLAASIAAVSNVSCDPEVAKPLALNIAAVSQASVSVSVERHLQATISGQSTATANVDRAVTLSAVVGSQSALSTSVQVDRLLAVAVNAVSSIQSNAALEKPLRGEVGAQSAVSADIQISKPLQAAIGSLSALTMDLSVSSAVELSASINAAASLTTQAQASKNLEAISAGQSSVTVSVTVGHHVHGVIGGQAQVVASLQISKNLAAQTGSTSAISATLSQSTDLAATIAAVSTLSAKVLVVDLSTYSAVVTVVNKPGAVLTVTEHPHTAVLTVTTKPIAAIQVL